MISLVLFYFSLFLLGIAIGLFGTLIGAGGGFILMPILLFVFPKETPDTLTSISLTVTFINALSGTIAYSRMKRINYRNGLIFSAAAVPGAIVGAYLTQFISREVFSLIFSFILIAVSIFIFFYGKVEEHTSKSHKIKLSSSKLITGIIFSLFIGLASSFLGIGGGIIHVPVLANILMFSVHAATATSHFILAITSFAGLAVHVFTGKFQYGIRRASAISLGALIGAQIGAKLSTRVHGKIIIRILAVALFFVGIRLIILYFFK